MTGREPGYGQEDAGVKQPNGEEEFINKHQQMRPVSGDAT